MGGEGGRDLIAILVLEIISVMFGIFPMAVCWIYLTYSFYKEDKAKEKRAANSAARKED